MFDCHGCYDGSEDANNFGSRSNDNPLYTLVGT